MAITNKIMLKETTKMSLHERFTVYRKQNQVQQQIHKQQQQQLGVLGSDLVTHTLQQQRMQQRLQRQASIKNQRLALQMANRPSVQAALKLKKRSLRQRLGQGGDFNSPMRASGVKSRLSFQSFGLRNRLGGFQGGSIGRSPGGRGGRTGFRNGRYFRGGGLRSSGTSPMLRGRLGAGAGASRTRSNTGQNRRQQFKRGRGGGQRGFNRNGLGRGGFKQAQNRGRGRGGRNNSRGGRGFRKGNWNQQQDKAQPNRPRSARGGRIPSKQDLDNDLDEYMAKTKSHLDAELDAYMAQGE